MVYQLCNICIKLGSCFSGMIRLKGLPLFYDKAQAGKTTHSAEFLFFSKTVGVFEIKYRVKASGSNGKNVYSLVCLDDQDGHHAHIL